MAVTQLSQQANIKAKGRASAKVAVGAASAAFLSSGIGCFVIGLLTTFSVISEGLKDALNWWGPAGPLVGKTGVGILVWLISWAILHSMWKEKEDGFSKVYITTLILIALGFILTFPPVFEAFG